MNHFTRGPALTNAVVLRDYERRDTTFPTTYDNNPETRPQGSDEGMKDCSAPVDPVQSIQGRLTPTTTEIPSHGFT